MIPVFEPDIGQAEIDAVVDALKKGEISGSFGGYIPAFEAAMAAYVGTRFGVACTSGTTALQLAVLTAGIGPGDEVLISASTNIATALAVTHNGAIPVPVDSEPVTWNLNLDLLEGLITHKTRGIIPVHLYGHPVDMDRLMAIARKHHLIVIEDCAESHGAKVRGRMTGQFGQMSCYSFYANKIITTGEGGMVLTDDEQYMAKLRLLRNLAFTEPRFRHEVLAHQFRMTGYQAAMGLVQTRRLEAIVAEKRRVAHEYNRQLKGVPGLQIPAELEWARNVYWMYSVVVGDDFGVSRDELIRQLKARQIESRTFFCPMNIQPALQRYPGFRQIDCPVAESLWARGLYLPSAHTLTEAQIRAVCDAIKQVVGRG